MRHAPWLPRPALAAAVSGLIVLALSAQAQVAPGKPTGAEAACERAAREALAAQTANPAEVTFNAAPAVQPTLSSDSQIVLRGAGRWRGPGGLRSFEYSCNVDPRTAAVVGLVMRDSTAAPAQAAPIRAPTEPDLSHLSPAACESSAAEALKQRWPRVSQISFNSDTRSLLQESSTRARLRGHVSALPEPGLPSTHLGFDCEIDPRDGRVLSTRITG